MMQPNYTGMNGQSTYAMPYTGQPSNPTWSTPYLTPNNMYNQPYNPQPTYQNDPQNQQPQQKIDSKRIWVQGETSAKAYIVSNNTEQVLWDSDQPVIYIKTVDATGRPNLVVLDYVIRNPKPAEDQNETEALKSEINDLKNMMQQLITQVQQKNYKQPYKVNKTNVQGGEEQ